MSTARQLVTIPGTELHVISSTKVDQEFHISVALPATYVEGDQAYPVMYVLDGNFFLGTVTEAYRAMDFFNELQEIIIVGVGYPDIVTFKSGMGVRTRDYTPTNCGWYETKYAPPGSNAPRFVGEGEATEFLQFLSEELVPYINTTYRTLPEENALLGFSFSGLFGLFALFKQPSTFKRYCVGSPSLWWDSHAIFDFEQEFASKDEDLNAWLFMSIAGDEPDFFISDMYKMAHTLKDRKYPSLKIVTHYFNGENHPSVIPAFISRGLKAAFARNE
jgi:predicted alpha/beta superfamily hydrolase